MLVRVLFTDWFYCWFTWLQLGIPSTVNLSVDQPTFAEGHISIMLQLHKQQCQQPGSLAVCCHWPVIDNVRHLCLKQSDGRWLWQVRLTTAGVSLAEHKIPIWSCERSERCHSVNITTHLKITKQTRVAFVSYLYGCCS